MLPISGSHPDCWFLAEKFGLLENLLYICSQNEDDMDVAFILDKYFKGMESVSIDVFDSQTLNAVYRDVVKAMTSHFEIEVSVLQALSYCLYEMMDNVHIHSGKPLGTAMTHYDDSQKMLRILIADDGKGIRASLAENGFWQGTLIYMEIGTGEEIDPSQIVDHRA